MPAVTISPPAKFSSELITGAPLAGGRLYTYAGGTSTPRATYTDSTGGIANTNPVILDARGEANVWLEQGVAYKYVLRDANDVLIWTVDNINSSAGGAGITTLFGNGTVTAPSISFANSTGMGFYRIANNVLGLATAGVNALTVDASQNIGLGITPTVKLDVNGGARVAGNLNVTSGGLTVAAGGASVTGGLTVPSGGAAITGNSSVAGNFAVSGGTFASRGFADNAAAAHWQLDAAGRLINTSSVQPAFAAYRGTSQQNAGTVLIYNTPTLNQGGHYNAGNGVFTAPIAGIYAFTASAEFTNSTGAELGHRLQINCSSAGVIAGISALYRNGVTYSITTSVIVKLAAGETVNVQTNTALSALFVLTTTQESRFSGYLLA